MHNMINMFLTQARQTVVYARTALESMISVRHDYSSYDDAFNDEMTFVGSANANAEAVDITPGFHSGEDLPTAWD